MLWPRAVYNEYKNRVENVSQYTTREQTCVEMENIESPIFDVDSLCAFLGTDPWFVEAVTDNIKHCYTTFYIDKDTKRITPYNDNLNMREVNAPCKGLKRWQIKLMEFLNLFPKHPANYAFIEGRSIKDAATSIMDKDTLIHIDLKDFFTEHSSLYVGKVLQRLIEEKGWQITEQARNIIVKLCCLYNNFLPQGSPCSPLITIICNYEMDKRLDEVAAKYDLVYTRYADDLWFGSKEKLKYNTKKIISEIKDAVHPFRINFKKLNVMRERALPLLDGYTILPSKVLSSAQWGMCVRHLNNVVAEYQPKFSYANKVISIEFTTRPDIPVDEIKDFGRNLIPQELLNIEDLTFTVKPKLFYIQSTKKCLGMHLTNNMVKYPRKKYIDLRMQAFLLGRQRALYKFYHHPSNRLTSRSIERIVKSFAGLKRPDVNKHRNLFVRPLNRLSFNGKVAFLASIDAEKAAKIKQVEQASFAKCVQQIIEYCLSHGIPTSFTGGR